MQTYESTVSITQVYTLAKLRKRKDKYTIQVFKVDFPTSQSILVSPPDMDFPPLIQRSEDTLKTRFFKQYWYK